MAEAVLEEKRKEEVGAPERVYFKALEEVPIAVYKNARVVHIRGDTLVICKVAPPCHPKIAQNWDYFHNLELGEFACVAAVSASPDEQVFRFLNKLGTTCTVFKKGERHIVRCACEEAKPVGEK
jgi:hypothetical protein